MIPQTYLIGFTSIDSKGLATYLADTGQHDFLADMQEAAEKGISPGEILCSFYAKLCYRSLVLGKNSNLTGTRAISDNLQGIVKSGHGAVLEHCTLNFITTGCSRVFTHELVRHRAGFAFSQTSGRYCTVEDAKMVLPPIANDLPAAECNVCGGKGQKPSESFIGGQGTEFLTEECKRCEGTGYLTIAECFESDLEETKQKLAAYRKALGLDEPGCSFERKKTFTSMLRRLMPNGADNEIGWSVNLRALRHVLELRTSRHAEWEIRKVFHDVSEIIEKRWPTMLYGGTKGMHEGLVEWTGLHV